MHTDALNAPALVSAHLHPQFPLPGGVGLAPANSTPPPQEDLATPREDAPLITSSVSDKPQGSVECLVQECPEFLLRGMKELFPGVDLKSKKLSVITLSEKTDNDMTSWSAGVEEEREQLLEHVSACVSYGPLGLCAFSTTCIAVHVCVIYG